MHQQHLIWVPYVHIPRHCFVLIDGYQRMSQIQEYAETICRDEKKIDE